MTTDRAFYGFREKGAGEFRSIALELVPGDKCQLACENCYKQGQKCASTEGRMPNNFVKEVLSEAKSCGFTEAVFIGGEPTLHPYLPEFVHFATRLELDPIICTNGLRLAEPSYLESIALPGTTFVLHTPLPAKWSELNDTHVGKPGYNEMLQEVFTSLLLRKDITIVGQIVAIEKFLPHISGVFRWCLENGIVPFIENNRRFDSGKIYSGALSPERVCELFEELQKIDDSPPDILLPPAYAQPCTMAITGVHVKNFGGGDWGGVYSCCGQAVRHGDLKKDRLKTILQEPGMRVFKEQDIWIFGPCRQCRYYEFCFGGCRGEAFLAFGCPRASNPSCWHIPPDVAADPDKMLPPDCTGCPLEGDSNCRPLRKRPDRKTNSISR